MARLFISYKREEEAYAFALRQWLMDVQGWRSEGISTEPKAKSTSTAHVESVGHTWTPRAAIG